MASVWAMAIAVASMRGQSRQSTAWNQEETQAVQIEVGAPGLEDESVISPDDHPLSGIIKPGLGSWGPRHSFLVPGFTAGQTLQSGNLSSSGASPHITSVAGQLQGIQYLGRDGELRYVGAVRMDSAERFAGAGRFTNVHSLSVAKAVHGRRWRLLADDVAAYSNSSLLGDAGMEGLGSIVTEVSKWSGAGGIGLGSMTLQSGVAPDQTILTKVGGRLSNTALAEFDYGLGTRGTSTVASYHGLLHFFNNELSDSEQAGVVMGYDREVTARDTFGLLYGYMSLWFPGNDSNLRSQYSALLWGRNISGRFALELGAGPLEIGGTGKDLPRTQLTWQARASTMMRMHKGEIQLGAARMLTAGSGVLTGALTDSVQGTLAHSLHRAASISMQFAYARNQSLSSMQRYDTNVFGVDYSRHIGRTTYVFVSYNLNHQTASGCTPTFCGLTGTNQVFGTGLSWTARPVGLR
jgi:hypothetical protein